MAAKSWNKVELMGNLTRDPELRFTPNGAAVCTFGIATNRSYVAANGERQEDVDFHNIVAWNKLAELCNQLLKKGARTFVSGRLQNREWEGQDGQKRRTTEIVLEDMILLTPKTGGVSTVSDESLDSIAEAAASQAATPKKSAKAKEESPEPPETPTESPPEDSGSTPSKAEETLDDSDLPF